MGRCFYKETICRYVVESIKYCQQEKGLILYGWCLMSNHIHMIAASKNSENTLSDIIRDFKKFTSTKIIDSIKNESGESRRNWMLWIFSEAGKKNSNNTTCQFWQQDNHPEELISNKFMDQKLDYIHNNPLEAGITECAEYYLYSSARNYCGMKGMMEVELIG
jgi:putative transposase